MGPWFLFTPGKSFAATTFPTGTPEFGKLKHKLQWHGCWMDKIKLLFKARSLFLFFMKIHWPEQSNW